MAPSAAARVGLERRIGGGPISTAGAHGQSSACGRRVFAAPAWSGRALVASPPPSVQRLCCGHASPVSAATRVLAVRRRACWGCQAQRLCCVHPSPAVAAAYVAALPCTGFFCIARNLRCRRLGGLPWCGRGVVGSRAGRPLLSFAAPSAPRWGLIIPLAVLAQYCSSGCFLFSVRLKQCVPPCRLSRARVAIACIGRAWLVRPFGGWALVGVIAWSVLGRCWMRCVRLWCAGTHRLVVVWHLGACAIVRRAPFQVDVGASPGGRDA